MMPNPSKVERALPARSHECSRPSPPPSTGKVIDVPLFTKEGEKVRIDTRTGESRDRA